MIYISHLFPDDQMEELIRQSGMGVESIDFSIADNLDHFSESIDVYREKLKKMGTRELILHGPFLDVNPAAYDRLVREVTMKRFDQCYQAGLLLGTRKIVFHSGMNPYVYYKQGWADQVSRFFSEFMDGRQKLEIVLENVFDDDWELLLDVYKKVDHPNFKLCLDIGHAHCYSSVDVREWAKALAPYVTHVHVHDNLGDRDADTGLGRGNLPYQQVLENLPLTEERTWTIECMKKEDAQLCWEKIRALEGGAL